MNRKEVRIGLKRGTVQLFEHSEEWKMAFEMEKKLLQKVFGKRLKRIEHIGSTAIFGIASKPIIDMMAVVDSIEVHCIEALIADFEALDYTYRNLNGDENRRLFVKGSESNRTHHLSLVEEGEEFLSALFFRDYLRANEQERLAYEGLKRELELKYGDNRKAYTAGKTDFIRRIVGLRE